jgi:hypothetical protein
MEARLIALVALGLAACQPRVVLPERHVPPATLSFPIGTYTNCAQGARNPSGNLFLNTAGFHAGAVLTLAQTANAVTATYVDQNGLTLSASFSMTTGATATLAPADQVIPGFHSLCVKGPRDQTPYPASMTTRDGALIYNAGMVFITLAGGLESDAGPCGPLSAPEATFWVICEDREGGALPSPHAGSPPDTPLPAGQYACSSQVETRAQIDGINYFVAGGGSGTLTLTQDGATASAAYVGDTSLAGTLSLGVTTSTTAGAEAGQTLTASCVVPAGTEPRTPEPLPIAAGALAISDSTLFLSFAGTMAAGSSCPGTQVAGSVICSM